MYYEKLPRPKLFNIYEEINTCAKLSFDNEQKLNILLETLGKKLLLAEAEKYHQ